MENMGLNEISPQNQVPHNPRIGRRRNFESFVLGITDARPWGTGQTPQILW